MLNYQKQNEWQTDNNYPQSPIAINAADVIEINQIPEITVINQLVIDDFTNNGNSLVMTGNGSLRIEGKYYDFGGMHFHHPAEHVINGKRADFELHLVFKNLIGQILVIAFPIELGKPTKLMENIIALSNFAVPKVLFNELHGYHYLGSLTTPPLNPGVEWLVIDKPKITIGIEQLKWISSHFPINARVIQQKQQRNIEKF